MLLNSICNPENPENMRVSFFSPYQEHVKWSPLKNKTFIYWKLKITQKKNRQSDGI